MHSRIFEISRQPVDRKERLQAGDVPEWFLGSIADYVDDIREGERMDETDGFVESFSGACQYVPEKEQLIFHPQAKMIYGQEKYAAFIQAAKNLSGVSLAGFCYPDRTLSENLSRLNHAYNDKYGYYVYDYDADEYLTLDEWVHLSDLTQPCYVGGILDYHF